jgi:hypothetical protein
VKERTRSDALERDPLPLALGFEALAEGHSEPLPQEESTE